jgi:hypothetical protein
MNFFSATLDNESDMSAHFFDVLSISRKNPAIIAEQTAINAPLIALIVPRIIHESKNCKAKSEIGQHKDYLGTTNLAN